MSEDQVERQDVNMSRYDFVVAARELPEHVVFAIRQDRWWSLTTVPVLLMTVVAGLVAPKAANRFINYVLQKNP